MNAQERAVLLVFLVGPLLGSSKDTKRNPLPFVEGQGSLSQGQLSQNQTLVAKMVYFWQTWRFKDKQNRELPLFRHSTVCLVDR